MHESYLVFSSTQDVVLTAEGVTLNTGHWQLAMSPKEGSVRLKALKWDGYETELPGPENDIYPHPHVELGFNVLGDSPCWGNIESRVYKSLADLQLATTASLAGELLHHFNPGNPYASMRRILAEHILAEEGMNADAAVSRIQREHAQVLPLGEWESQIREWAGEAEEEYEGEDDSYDDE